jgi:hypothetical protein
LVLRRDRSVASRPDPRPSRSALSLGGIPRRRDALGKVRGRGAPTTDVITIVGLRLPYLVHCAIEARRDLSYVLASAKFSTWAWIKIESEIATALCRGESDWFPKDPPPPPRASYSNERVYEWTSWEPHGNAAAISETWQQRAKDRNCPFKSML